MFSFTKKEIALMKSLNTPAKVQDFLNGLKFNFEEKGETLKSPIQTLRVGKAHCFEGALLGAYLLSLKGQKPLILHLKTTKDDFDHVIALFQQNGLWGALSKTNHAVLRYREPIYKNIHELVMSYFHEYFLDNGKKTLRQYSRPLNLNIFPARSAFSTADAGGKATAISFFSNQDSFGKKIEEGMNINLLATFDLSRFRGREELRLRIVDLSR